MASFRVALSGESAGAGLVLSTMLKLRDTGGALPVAAEAVRRCRPMNAHRPTGRTTGTVQCE